MNVFVDASAFYALLAKSDAHHREASERWRGLIAQPSNQLFTSNYVIAEACGLLGNRLGRGAVRDFVEVLLPATHVLWVDEASTARPWRRCAWVRLAGRAWWTAPPSR